ncbi:MAG: two-component regulator propeller domain-containing protein [Flavobacteriales bacterium]
MPRQVLLLLAVALFNFPLFAQVAVGQWRDHLPYAQGVQVADAGEWIYSASESGLFQYHKQDGDVIRLSKVSGMSDIGFSSVAWSDINNTLVVGYTNTNIDLIRNGEITNIPDIKNKSILGLKTINNIHIKDDYAYLACGFAIVVVDIVRQEIRDTYYIGPEGTSLNILDVATSESSLFACTESGVYSAQLEGTNLANFENWTKFTDLSQGTYNAGTWFDNKLYVNLSDESETDSIFFLNGSNWNHFSQTDEQEIRSLESSEDRLLVIAGGSVAEFNDQHTRLRLAYNYGGGAFGLPNHATIDDEGTIWIADRSRGLVRHPTNQTFSMISVNGPRAASCTGISIWDGRCYVAGGGVTSIWSNSYISDGIYAFKENTWSNIRPFSNPETQDFRDFIRTKVDPFDSKRVYASAWGYGLVEYYDDELAAIYDTTNSTFQTTASNSLQVGGLEIDRNTGTLWVATSGTEKSMHAKDVDGNWYGFDLDAVNNFTMADITIDDSGQKWIVAARGVGVVVFNDGGTLDNTNDDQSIKLNQSNGNGALAGNNVFSIATDFDGEVWVGTENGISVFYSPESVFSGDNFDSQQILIEQDGYVQYLLENEVVTAIAVDGANRKWLGTASAGVFLMSEDGTEEILHFTQENSPLFSDRITAIGIDHLSGEVFIGTDKGIVSYKGTATWGTPEFEKERVYAYPNPVEPDYEGPIAIKGLVRDADVKITDAAGNIVFATTAEGGQAIWSGNKITGGRAKSGVYLVFASNDDGKETFVTKVLLIN